MTAKEVARQQLLAVHNMMSLLVQHVDGEHRFDLNELIKQTDTEFVALQTVLSAILYEAPEKYEYKHVKVSEQPSEQALNNIGAEGWMLVSMEYRWSMYQLFFVRKK